jgi:hypothetical protein
MTVVTLDDDFERFDGLSVEYPLSDEERETPGALRARSVTHRRAAARYGTIDIYKSVAMAAHLAHRSEHPPCASPAGRASRAARNG